VEWKSVPNSGPTSGPQTPLVNATNGAAGGQAAAVARPRVEVEQHAALADRVDEVLEDPGNAVVPHRYGEQVLVRGGEAGEDALDIGPGLGGGADRIPAGERVHLGLDTASVVARQAAVPQVEGVDLDVRRAGEVLLEEHGGDAVGLGLLTAR
jgi:hypothetical protein